MAQPTGSDLHVDAALTQISVGYKMKAENNIADKMFPTVPVAKQSGKVFVWDKNDMMRDEAAIRAPGTESAGGGLDVTSSTTYYADVVAFHKDVADQDMANSDLGNLPIIMSEYVTQKLLIKRERDFVTNYFGVDLWADQGTPNDATGSASSTTWPYFICFSDGANSDPLGTIRTAKRKILETTGYLPNKLLVGVEAHDVIALHPDVAERVKYTQGGVPDRVGMVSQPEMAALCGIEEYLVGMTSYATNVENETATYSFNFGKNMLLVYAAPTPSLLLPSGGYIFEWTGFNGMGQNVKMDSFYERKLESTRYEGEMAYDQKLLCSDVGIYFSGAVE